MHHTVLTFESDFEASPCDAYIVVIDGDLADLPSATASDYERWQWARSKPRGIRWIPLDIKSCKPARAIGSILIDSN